MSKIFDKKEYQLTGLKEMFAIDLTAYNAKSLLMKVLNWWLTDVSNIIKRQMITKLPKFKVIHLSRYNSIATTFLHRVENNNTFTIYTRAGLLLMFLFVYTFVQTDDWIKQPAQKDSLSRLISLEHSLIKSKSSADDCIKLKAKQKKIQKKLKKLLKNKAFRTKFKKLLKSEALHTKH